MDWGKMRDARVFYDNKGKPFVSKQKLAKPCKVNRAVEQRKHDATLSKRIDLLVRANRIISEHGFKKVRKLELKAAKLEEIAGLPHPQPGQPYSTIMARIARAIQYITTGTDAIKIGHLIMTKDQLIDEFYASYEWKELRYKTILKYGRTCMACGKENCIVNVDHIKPLRKFWGLRLDPDNLQILCGSCNQGKGHWDQTDWRPKEDNYDDVVLSVLDDDTKNTK